MKRGLYHKPGKEFGIMRQFLNELKDVKKSLRRVESILAEDHLTTEDRKEIKKSREEIKRGEYVTLEQLKKELRGK